MKEELFRELCESVIEAGKIRRGEIPASRTFVYSLPDVKAIRRRMGRTQHEFALLIGVSVATVRNWEQGRNRPKGPAMALLRIAEHNPELVEDILRL